MAEIITQMDSQTGPSLADEAAAIQAAAAERAKTAVPNADNLAATNATTANAGDRPAWLPQNFKSVDDFVKSYNDGRAELTRTQQELATFKKPAADPAATATPDPAAAPAANPDPAAPAAPQTEAEKSAEAANKAAADALNKAGFDPSPFTAEFNSTGDVSAESRAKIAEALKGQFGDAAKSLVDQYVEGSKAVADSLRAAGLEAAGGADRYSEMSQWAKANWSPDQIKAYDSQVNSGNRAAIALAVGALRAAFEAKNGTPPARAVTGMNTTANTSTVSAFSSLAEQNKAIQDPRYRSDPAYRNGVIQRMSLGRPKA